MHGTANGNGQPGALAPAARSASPGDWTRSSLAASAAGQARSARPSQAAANPSAASVTIPAAGRWIAQLASVAVSEGSASLQSELRKIQAEIPGAQYLLSSDYASVNPGYWVVYYPGSFSDGTQAIEYCAAHGRTTRDQCVGRFLSHDRQDKTYICLPPGGSQERGCSRSA